MSHRRSRDDKETRSLLYRARKEDDDDDSEDNRRTDKAAISAAGWRTARGTVVACWLYIRLRVQEKERAG